MHDSISFEQLGKPGLAICTTPFRRNVENMARAMGLPGFPVVMVDHPLGSRTDEEIAGRAEEAYAQALAILERSAAECMSRRQHE